MDGHLSRSRRSFVLKYTILDQSGQFRMKKWTAKKFESERSRSMKSDCQKSDLAIRLQLLFQTGYDHFNWIWFFQLHTVLWNLKKLKKLKTFKLNGLRGWKWTVLRNESGRSRNLKVDGLKGWKRTVLKSESRRSYGMKVNALMDWNWTVLKVIWIQNFE